MTRLLQEADPLAEFVCERGAPQVEYLRNQALAADADDLSRTYVELGRDNDPPLVGFYAICMGRISSTDLPENKGKKTPHTQTPAALLAQLATDDRVARGEGRALVLDALERIAGLADQIGCAGAFLHAQVDALIPYYTRLGFRRIGRTDAANRAMWMSMKDVRATLAFVAAEDPTL